MYFYEDENEEAYDRKILSFVDILEGLGGIFEIIFIFSTFLISPFNSFLYQSYLIKCLYLFENEDLGAIRSQEKFIKL